MKFTKLIATLTFLLTVTMTTAQVGIGVAQPEAALDINSTDSGVLMPRIGLLSATDATTVVNPDGGALVNGTMIWNTGDAGLTPAGYYFHEDGVWYEVARGTTPQVFFGKLIISAKGSLNITDVPFKPESIEFLAVNRVQDYDETYRSDTNNSNDIRMAGGQTMGYAQTVGAGIDQQVISSAASGSSLNNIGTYSSDSHCIAAFFVNNNGEPIHDNGTATGGTDAEGGLISASLQSFDASGFTLNVDNYLGESSTGVRTNQIVVIYKAYR
ncbi:hypothetical protein LY01_00765 [Nonlabens xylanidelens]|uniref:Uncharacterized protein n=1 Tax=Nonlabens xylanidelens TaxID=191564 RepID=A0A2S6IS22_9FLAO|nr:hypothetical protein [Nonlabens xylanidelens]PPK96940.1 hypothetical protein LY01_00765 [Nonlabens xylanidelens]PQJ13635.1 hypothetical protein BST94_14895 [Nonlabens xylanidelens]